MRRLGLYDRSFESYDHTDSKNVKDKSRQPRGGALEHFVIYPWNRQKSLYTATTWFKSNNKFYFRIQ